MDEIKKDKYDLNYSENIDIANSQEEVVNISLDNTQLGTGIITGTVLDATNTSGEGATIKLFDSKGAPYMHTVTNELGNYTFAGLKSDSYSITCVKDKVVLTVPESIYLQENETKTHNFNIEKKTNFAIPAYNQHLSHCAKYLLRATHLYLLCF